MRTGSLLSGHGGQNGGAVDAARQEQAVRHVAALVDQDGVLDDAVDRGERCASARAGARWPGRTSGPCAARRSARPRPPAFRRAGRVRCPRRSWRGPVVNCSCSSSKAGFGPHLGGRDWLRRTCRAATMACGSEAKIRPSGPSRVIERLDAEGVAAQEDVDRAPGSCSAKAYMPRRCRRRSPSHGGDRAQAAARNPIACASGASGMAALIST